MLLLEKVYESYTPLKEATILFTIFQKIPFMVFKSLLNDMEFLKQHKLDFKVPQVFFFAFEC